MLDATVGQNGLAQAREFMAAAGVTGIVLAKLDGTAKGGIAVAIAHDLRPAHPLRRRRRGHGRPHAVLRRASTWTPFSRKAGRAVLADAAYMDRALLLAGRGAGRTTPNPMVGAVVVTPDGVVAGSGFHERAGQPHAEVHALDAAGEAARGATLYCTLEPCSHHGRTPPCVDRIVAAGIARVVAAVQDPNPRVAGAGFRALKNAGVRVDVGVHAEEAARLNRPFFSVMQRGRPFVMAKAATSLDGRVAARAGQAHAAELRARRSPVRSCCVPVWTRSP